MISLMVSPALRHPRRDQRILVPGRPKLMAELGREINRCPVARIVPIALVPWHVGSRGLHLVDDGQGCDGFRLSGEHLYVTGRTTAGRPGWAGEVSAPRTLRDRERSAVDSPLDAERWR